MTVLSDKSGQLLHAAFKFILQTTGSITQGFSRCIPNIVFLNALLLLISLHGLCFLVCANTSWYVFQTFFFFLNLPLNILLYASKHLASQTPSQKLLSHTLLAVSFSLPTATPVPSSPNHLITAVLWWVSFPVQAQFNYVFLQDWPLWSQFVQDIFFIDPGPDPCTACSKLDSWY